MRARPIVTSLLVGVAVSIPTSASAISGGQEAKSDYIVQIATQTNLESKKIDHCTGSALNSEWIITAAHCIEDAASDTSASIYFSNSKDDPGEPISSAKIVPAPAADLALIQLSQPHELSQYATLAADHRFTEKERGYIYGYGRGIAAKPMSHLRRAEVSQSYQGRDQYWNEVYRLEGVDGTSNHGDSGGPFIVNGKLVGINILGSHVADNYWIGEVSGALQLSPFVSWIEKETGAKAVPFAQVTAAPAPSPEGTTPAPEADGTPAGDDDGKQPDSEAHDPAPGAPATPQGPAPQSPAAPVPPAPVAPVPAYESSPEAPASNPEASKPTSPVAAPATGTGNAVVPETPAATVQGGGKAELAFTGSAIAPLAAAGILSLAAGALLVRRGSSSPREA
ncbi:trypsin-like serine protease [Trueperella pecoris]|uniref:trypsin n=1 Tax=Trueperella pecoris TaxID=2733571 RepID=A0A7M1QYQ9_9ACTO|nr:S1 family peptidase [Trueperella pecoris]QOR47088.1 trypsin-like serine protease [Trueperella pecoris]